MKNFIVWTLCILWASQMLLFAQSKGGRWEFENNGFDTAEWDAAENTGMLQNQASFGSELPLAQGSFYLLLDSSEVHDYFQVTDDSDLDFTDEDIAISLWIYPFVLDDVHYLINKGRQDSNPKTTNYALRIANNTRKFEFLIRDANNQAQRVSSSFAIEENQWTFVAVFYDFSESTVYMWNDPEAPPPDTLAFAQSFFANDDPLAIGTWYRNDPAAPTIKDFEGRIDDVRISGRLSDVLPAATAIPPRELPVNTVSEASLEVYPNPSSLARNQANIKIHLTSPGRSRADLVVYNILGQEVFRRPLPAAADGRIVSWKFSDNQGRRIPAGIYFVRLSGEKLNVFKKIMILK